MEGTVEKRGVTAIVHLADSRGKANYGWLNTAYSFSFAQYYNPDRVHFGALRVLNDDIVGAGRGFDTHPHDNMEIITIPLFGTLMHKDSMGHEQTLGVNEVQVMSAGTGLFHAEYNASQTESLGLFQIWIIPEVRNVEPVYNQRLFNTSDAQGKWQTLVGPNGTEGDFLKINQKAYISRVFLNKGESISCHPSPLSFGNYIMVVEGSANVGNVQLKLRDAAGILNNGTFEITASEPSYILNIEVPDIK